MKAIKKGQLMRPIITDNDKDEITATLNGRELRAWTYTEATQRQAMKLAREYMEGWRDATESDPTLDITRTLRCSAFHFTMDDAYAFHEMPGISVDDYGQPTISVIPWLNGNQPPQASEALNAVMRFAIDHDCDRVNFDEDGPELRGFPVFEHNDEDAEADQC